MEFFLHDSYKHRHRQSDPDLSKDRVFGSAIECFDSQMLFEPAEEKFHLPVAAIQFGYSNGRDREIVGQEDKTPAGLPSLIALRGVVQRIRKGAGEVKRFVMDIPSVEW